ncbi:MAG: GntR family transcriptional regulator [Acidimicrobiales bacterium]
MTNLVYQRAAAELRRRISIGSYAKTASLPTEAELCADLDISRSSLRRALQLLRNEGLLVSRQGSGWSVAPTLPAARLGIRVQDESSSPSQASSHVSHQIVVSHEIVVGHQMAVPPEAVATVLSGDAPQTETEQAETEQVEQTHGKPLLLIERVSKLDDIVVHRTETWFASLVSSTIDIENAKTQPPALLLSKLGYQLSRFEQYAEATLSDSRDEELIGLPPGTAVLQITRTAFDETNTALFQSRHRHPGASTKIDINLPTTNEPSAGSVSLSPDR